MSSNLAVANGALRRKCGGKCVFENFIRYVSTFCVVVLAGKRYHIGPVETQKWIMVSRWCLLYKYFLILFGLIANMRTHRNYVSQIFLTWWKLWKQLILTWHRGNLDQLGGSSRARPFHCTTVRLTFAITPNVGDSGASFLIVGDCVRAIPW